MGDTLTYLKCDSCGARRWQPAVPQTPAVCLRCGAELSASTLESPAAAGGRFARRQVEFITHRSGRPSLVLRRAGR
jgi:ribosomal protein S27E